MGKIATLNEAYQIAGNGATTSSICATKDTAQKAGCKVAGTYEEQQLVQKTDLSKAVEKVNINYSIYFNAIPVGTLVRFSLVYKSTSGDVVRRGGASSGATITGVFECNKGEVYNLDNESYTSYGDLQSTARFTATQGNIVVCNIGY